MECQVFYQRAWRGDCSKLLTLKEKHTAEVAAEISSYLGMLITFFVITRCQVAGGMNGKMGITVSNAGSAGSSCLGRWFVPAHSSERLAQPSVSTGREAKERLPRFVKCSTRVAVIVGANPTLVTGHRKPGIRSA